MRPSSKWLGLAAATLIAVPALVVGCGGDSSDGGATADGAPLAQYLPGSSPLYVGINTDADAAQWDLALDLAQRFPAYERAEREIFESLDEEGIDFEQDIVPLLGGAAAFATGPLDAEMEANLDGDLIEEAGIVGVLELAEDGEDAAMRLLTDDGDLAPAGEHDGTVYYGDDDDTFVVVRDGLLAIADSEENLTATIDLMAGSGESLAGEEKVGDALAGLSDEALMRMYVDVGRLVSAGLNDSNAPSVPGFDLDPGRVGDSAFGAVVLAEERGFRMRGQVVGVDEELAVGGRAFAPGLLDHVPDDAVAYMGLADISGAVEAAIERIRESGNEDVASQLDQASGALQTFLGVSVDDVRALGTGEHAVVVAPDGSAQNIGVGAILQVEDGARAASTLDALREALPALAGFTGDDTFAGAPRELSLADGVTGWEITLQGTSVTYAVVDDLVLLASSVELLRSLQSTDSSLGASADFAADTAGMPGSVTGLFWLDVDGAIAVADRAGAIDPEDREELAEFEPLRSLAGWSDGDAPQSFEMFLHIDE